MGYPSFVYSLHQFVFDSPTRAASPPVSRLLSPVSHLPSPVFRLPSTTSRLRSLTSRLPGRLLPSSLGPHGVPLVSDRSDLTSFTPPVLLSVNLYIVHPPYPRPRSVPPGHLEVSRSGKGTQWCLEARLVVVQDQRQSVATRDTSPVYVKRPSRSFELVSSLPPRGPTLPSSR